MFALGLLAFSRGWLGGGDVKLMTAIAAWTGLAGLPLMFLATSISGGALALVYAVGRRALHRAPRRRHAEPSALCRGHRLRDAVVAGGDARRAARARPSATSAR